MNAMIIINPYKVNNTWLFDDDAVGLVREPFVLGMSEMIDECLKLYYSDKEIKDFEQNGFELIFSHQEFPKSQFILNKIKDEYGGAWYKGISKEFNEFNKKQMKGWLCPALNKYIPIHPDKIYASFK